MILNTKSRYAVMAIIDLVQCGDKVPVSLVDISQRQGISLSYLEQIFSKLKNNNIVCSIKGPGGGYFLSKEADSLTVMDIINGVNESIKMTGCGIDKDHGCVNKSIKCNSHELWVGLGNIIQNYLTSIPITHISKIGNCNYNSFVKEIECQK